MALAESKDLLGAERLEARKRAKATAAVPKAEVGFLLE